MSYPVQPIRNHLPRHDGRCLTDEDEKSSLEHIFGIVVREEPAAHTPTHRAVTLDKGCEGSFVPMFDVGSMELPIGHPPLVLKKRGFAKVLNDLVR
jgi:hypothetical protein